MRQSHCDCISNAVSNNNQIVERAAARERTLMGSASSPPGVGGAGEGQPHQRPLALPNKMQYKWVGVHLQQRQHARQPYVHTKQVE